MSRNEIFRQIEGYDEHLRDMEVCRKYGIGYTMTSGEGTQRGGPLPSIPAEPSRITDNQ